MMQECVSAKNDVERTKWLSLSNDFALATTTNVKEPDSFVFCVFSFVLQHPGATVYVFSVDDNDKYEKSQIEMLAKAFKDCHFVFVSKDAFYSTKKVADVDKDIARYLHDNAKNISRILYVSPMCMFKDNVEELFSMQFEGRDILSPISLEDNSKTCSEVELVNIDGLCKDKDSISVGQLPAKYCFKYINEKYGHCFEDAKILLFEHARNKVSKVVQEKEILKAQLDCIKGAYETNE